MSEQAPQTTEAQIAVHWREEELYQPPASFVAQANAADPAILERFSEQHFPDCFTEYADLLTWEKRWDTVLVTMDSYYRNGELLDHKVKADEAVERAAELGQRVDKVLVWRRFPGEYHSKSPMVEGRDFFVDEVLVDYHRQLVEPVSQPAE